MATRGAYFTTDTHEDLREAVKSFAQTHVRPRIPAMEAAGTPDHELAALIAAQGWLAVTVARKDGGLGLGHLAKTIVIEELSAVSAAAGAIAQASQLGVAKILRYGDSRQKRTWLPAIRRGECLPTIAVTEPASGSNVLGMTLRAELDGGQYVLNGRKVYVGNSAVGTLHGVVARTGTGSKGLSAFLVEADRPGLQLGPHRPAMGLHGFSFGELIFTDCRIPAANRLGQEGDGLAIAYSSSVLYGRPNLAAVALGIHRALVDATVDFVKEQRRYGHPLGDLDTIRQKLGAMQSRLMTARLALYHACHLLDLGVECDGELQNAKLINVEYALDSARTAMEIHGATGLHTDRPIERYLRDAHHLFAPAGTSDIQRLRLAEQALGESKGSWSTHQPGSAAALSAGEAVPAPIPHGAR
nr:acyl-CoA dehydrogenase family protein [Kitasatospora purpeofusca]